MYSGWLLTNFSGAIFGAHQRIDRVARKYIKKAHGSAQFPHKKQILHFEGKNGPDGLKKKSAGRDEPWHFYDPFDPDDSQLLDIISDHYSKLVQELKQGNQERAAFEAAWLAHALVDGLTPAHHYPYEQKLAELRGADKSTRGSFKEKVYIKGINRIDTIKKNWAFWGAKGLFTTHFMFEFGISSIIMLPHIRKITAPTQYDLKTVHQLGLVEYFKRLAREVSLMNMYENFYKWGWTPQLAKQARKDFAPLIFRIVSVAWYKAMYDAGLIPAAVKVVSDENN